MYYNRFLFLYVPDVSGSNSSGSCDIRFLDNTEQLMEPIESRKFARFNLQYTEMEEKPSTTQPWEPRFSGHQSLREREISFVARDQTVNCGFIKGPEGTPSTGFDLAEDDINYISKCHIAVISCIFGNSDHLRTPTGRSVRILLNFNCEFSRFLKYLAYSFHALIMVFWLNCFISLFSPQVTSPFLLFVHSTQVILLAFT